MAYHVLRGELGERDAAHRGKDAARLDQAALLAAREIDLRDVAVHHRLCAEADACEEHLHLLGRGVLRFVEDDERVVERSEEHTSELQSQSNLVCRLLLEKKNTLSEH